MDIEHLNSKTAGRNKSFPPRHAKNKNMVAKKENGLDKILIARENAEEYRYRPFIPSVGIVPLIQAYEANEQILDARSLRENAKPGELSKHVFDEIVDERIELDEAARKLAQAWGLK